MIWSTTWVMSVKARSSRQPGISQISPPQANRERVTCHHRALALSVVRSRAHGRSRPQLATFANGSIEQDADRPFIYATGLHKRREKGSRRHHSEQRTVDRRFQAVFRTTHEVLQLRAGSRPATNGGRRLGAARSALRLDGPNGRDDLLCADVASLDDDHCALGSENYLK